jgi:hypothetical protein
MSVECWGPFYTMKIVHGMGHGAWWTFRRRPQKPLNDIVGGAQNCLGASPSCLCASAPYGDGIVYTMKQGMKHEDVRLHIFNNPRSDVRSPFHY